MNRSYLVLLVPAYCLVALACATEQGSADLRLLVNGAPIPVFFEDQAVTDREKTTILADYQLVIEQLAPQARRPVKTRRIERGTSTVLITSVLTYSAIFRKGPGEYKDQFGIIGESDDGHEYIVIQETLSDAYIVALKLALDHKEACRSLERFIALLNGLDTRQLPSMGDLYFLYGEAKKYSEEIAGKSKQEFVDDCKKYRYSRGSVLELRLFEGNLMTNIHAMTRDSGKHKSGIPLIYHEDHWKIFITLTE